MSARNRTEPRVTAQWEAPSNFPATRGGQQQSLHDAWDKQVKAEADAQAAREAEAQAEIG